MDASYTFFRFSLKGRIHIPFFLTFWFLYLFLYCYFFTTADEYLPSRMGTQRIIYGLWWWLCVMLWEDSSGFMFTLRMLTVSMMIG
ncbi:hypothetical protein B0H66DRAFT_181468 [Apodospora peruviana]|uniref:Uncharacterized protein n=1 Tax=Apodospora peruviana TaxID=516989 RepID=A0AAE0IBB8_9PEZI|nr:hypothetical protein B0H66DRAFT_181468 [Apodospora peruviana]